MRAILWSTIYWEPAAKLVWKVLGIHNKTFIKQKWTWSRSLGLVFRAALLGVIIYFGTRIWIREGFLGQNLIYTMIK